MLRRVIQKRGQPFRLRMSAIATTVIFILMVCIFSVIPRQKIHVAGYDDLEGSAGYDDPYGQNDPYGDGYGGGEDNMKPPSPYSVARQLNSIAEIDEYLKASEGDLKATVLGYFDKTTNSEDIALFEELAGEEANKFRFAYSTTKEVLEEKKCDGFSLYVYLPGKFVNEKYDRPKQRYPSKTITGSQQLKNFVFSKSLPLVGELTFANKPIYDKDNIPYLTVFTAVDLNKNFKGFNYLANRVRKVAKEFKKKMHFNIASKAEFNYILESDYGFYDHSMKETVVGIRSGDFFYKLPASTPFSPETLKQFITDFFAGQLEGKEKPAPPPAPKSIHPPDEDQDPDSKVVQLTADNFKEMVQDSDADVMVEFYAPWCGHCKALKPEYKIVADNFAGDSKITVAAYDAANNALPKGFAVSGYPTLYFVPAKGKKPKQYDGGRDAESISTYIRSHRTTAPLFNSKESD